MESLGKQLEADPNSIPDEELGKCRPDAELVATLANTPGDIAVADAKALGAYEYDLLGGFYDSGFDPHVMQKLRDNGVSNKLLCEGMLYEVISGARELYDLMPSLAPTIISGLQVIGQDGENAQRVVDMLLSLPGTILAVVSEMQRAMAFDQDRAAKMHERFVVTKVNMTQ